MACSNYCSKNDFSQFSSSLGYGSRAKWGTATLSVTNERTLAHDIERAEKKYEVYVEASSPGDVGGKTAEKEAKEALEFVQGQKATGLEHIQKSEIQYQAVVEVSPTHARIAHASGNPSSSIVTAMIATAVTVTVLSKPVTNFFEGLTITVKGHLESKE